MSWQPDVLDGFEQRTLTLPDAIDGPVEVVLVRKRCASASNAGVLYVHGFVDYFFQEHLAAFYNERGLHFYAVDLRRHGRSLRSHQKPNDTRDLDEFLVDVGAAIDVMTGEEGIAWLLLNGHSTGGLVGALYAHRGRGRNRVDALFLNSPFLDMNLPEWQKHVLEPVLAALGRFFPTLPMPALPRRYGQSIHANYRGRWQYDLRWKPIEGFRPNAGWLRAIHRAQDEVARGLAIACPILVLHAARSLRPKQWTEEIHTADVVLDVTDMQRLSPRLGKNVEIHAIDGGIHDLTLSNDGAQARMFELLADWLRRIRN